MVDVVIERFADALEFEYGDDARLPEFKDFAFNVSADFAGNVLSGLHLSLEVIDHGFLRAAEVSAEHLVDRVAKFRQGAAVLLAVFRPVLHAALPDVAEGIYGLIVLQHLLVVAQIFELQLPAFQVLLLEIRAAIVLVHLLIHIAHILHPVSVEALFEHIHARGIDDMLQDAEFRIDHALESERADELRALDGHFHAVFHGVSLVKLIGEVVHVLRVVGTDDVAYSRRSGVDDEDARIDIVADDFRKVFKRIDGDAVLVVVAIDGDAVCHALDSGIEEVERFAVARHIVRLELSRLQRVEFSEGGIAVLVVSALVHVRFREVALRNHHIDKDFSVGPCLARLGHGIDDGARTRSAAQTRDDVYDFAVIVRHRIAAREGISQRIHVFRGVLCKEQASGAALLSGSLAKISDGIASGSSIADDAPQLRIVLYIVDNLRHCAALDKEKLILCERRILTHHVEVIASDAHHLHRGIYVEQCYRLLLAFFKFGELLKHSHLEGTQHFSARTAKSYDNVVFCHSVKVYIIYMCISRLSFLFSSLLFYLLPLPPRDECMPTGLTRLEAPLLPPAPMASIVSTRPSAIATPPQSMR